MQEFNYFHMILLTSVWALKLPAAMCGEAIKLALWLFQPFIFLEVNESSMKGHR
jgi:hypothetical protein